MPGNRFLHVNIRQQHFCLFRVLRPDGNVIDPAVDPAIGSVVAAVDLGAAAAKGNLSLIGGSLHDLDAGSLHRRPGGLPPGLVSLDLEHDLPLSEQDHGHHSFSNSAARLSVKGG